MRGTDQQPKPDADPTTHPTITANNGNRLSHGGTMLKRSGAEDDSESIPNANANAGMVTP